MIGLALIRKHVSSPKLQWAPPTTSDGKTSNTGSGKFETYIQLQFCKFNIESLEEDAAVDKHSFPENHDLLDAMGKVEYFWNLNMQLYKAMAMQRSYVLFLSACARMDKSTYVKTLVSQYGSTGAEFDKVKAALKKNVDAFKIQLTAIDDIMKNCADETKAIEKELQVWRKDWTKTIVKKTPKTIIKLVPHLIAITRASLTKAEQENVATNICKQLERFYPTKAQSATLDAVKQTALVNYLVTFCKGATDEGMDLTESAVAVVKAYYPSPTAEHLDFQDCFVDELNTMFAEAQLLVQKVETFFKNLDVAVWDAQLQCKVFDADPVPTSLKQSFGELAKVLKAENKQAKLHVFKQDTVPPTYQLAALVKKAGWMAKIAAYFGFGDIGRVSVPPGIQKVLQGIEQKLAKMNAAAHGITVALAELKEKRVLFKNDYLVSDVPGGATLLDDQLKQMDKAVISLAKKSTAANFKKLTTLEKLMDKRLGKHVAVKDLDKAIKNSCEQIKPEEGKSLREFLRVKKATSNSKGICGYVAATLFPAEEDKKDRDACVEWLKAEFVEHTSAFCPHIVISKGNPPQAFATGPYSKDIRTMKAKDATTLVGKLEVTSNSDRREIVRWSVSRCIEKFGEKISSSGGGPQRRNSLERKTDSSFASVEDVEDKEAAASFAPLDVAKKTKEIVKRMKAQPKVFSAGTVAAFEKAVGGRDEAASQHLKAESKFSPVEVVETHKAIAEHWGPSFEGDFLLALATQSLAPLHCTLVCWCADHCHDVFSHEHAPFKRTFTADFLV